MGDCQPSEPLLPCRAGQGQQRAATLLTWHVLGVTGIQCVCLRVSVRVCKGGLGAARQLQVVRYRGKGEGDISSPAGPDE